MLAGAVRALLRATVVGLGVVLAACGGGGGGGGGSSVVAPAISGEPADANVDDGSAVQFAVVATGDAPLTYQWRRGVALIAGANAATYSIPAAALIDSGATFSVTVSNPGGTVTSRAALLTVAAVAPAVTVGPLDATVNDGSAATFSVVATGSAPLAFQWLRNGVPVVGATTPTYSTTALALADDGAEYTVTVSNVAGSVTSPVSRVTVLAVAPSIGVPPSSVTVRDGAPVTLSVVASGSAPLSYRWLDASGPIPGATQPELTFSALFANSGASYRVEVSNAVGSIVSPAATVTVDPNAPTIDAAPANVSTAPGSTAAFSANASGTAPLSYQWERSDDAGASWLPIAGATASTFGIPDVTLSWAASRLRVVVTNPVTSVASTAATLTVVPNVHIVAGAIGGAGFSDGLGDSVRFNSPVGAVADSIGNIFVADSGNRVIRRVAPGGQTSVFVANGLQVPRALAVDAANNLYVGDAAVLRKVSPGAGVTFLAGGASGSTDGNGAAAAFGNIAAVAADAAGNLVVADGGSNQTVRTVSVAGEVTTLAGAAGQFGSVDGQGSAARFTNLTAVALDASGDAFVADNLAIRRVTSAGEVTLYAGLPGQSGNTDGPRLTARFEGISGLAFDTDGSLFVSDAWQIRRIAPDGTTTTVAGGTPAAVGVDGSGAAARISGVSALAALPGGQGFVFAEFGAATVRRVTAAGVVSTLAGVAPRIGPVDATGTAARFKFPSKVVAAADGSLFVAEPGSLRRISPGGEVTTLTGAPDLATFSAFDLARTQAGDFYVADAFSQVIRRVTSIGTITTWAGTEDTPGSGDGVAANATFNSPEAVAVDANGVVYVADSGNHTIRRIDANGAVTTLAGAAGQCGGVDGVGAAARFCGPLGIAVGPGGDVFVADTSTHTIRRITPAGVVTTYAGVLNSPGRSDGVVARFLQPRGLAFDALGNLYVADTGNSLVRRISPSRVTSTVMGQYGTAALIPGPGGAINAPTGVAVLPTGRIVVVSEQAIVGD